jgi:5-methylcytosine-specific restriction endonuclease McrA
MTTQQKKAKLRKKCDKLIQEAGRKTYKKCLVCGKPVSCLHHFYPKSTCSALRYDWSNLIPICNGCHFSHHNGNPEIHIKVIEKKGNDWLESLRAKKRNAFIKTTLEYYKKMENNLKLL